MKIGRNEPCPCGSGKKYKKCCLNKRQQQKSSPQEIDKQADMSPKKNKSTQAVNNRIRPYVIAKMCEPDDSNVVLNRMPMFKKMIKNQHLPSTIRKLSTKMIIKGLSERDIDFDPDFFIEKSQEYDSAWNLAEALWPKQSRSTKNVSDFCCLAACILWERYYDENKIQKLSFEMIDDFIENGYKAKHENEQYNFWIKAWNGLKSLFDFSKHSLQHIDKLFNGSQCLFNWAYDCEIFFNNSSIDNKEYAKKGIVFLNEFISFFSDDDEHLTKTFQRTLAEIYCNAGEFENGEQLAKKLLASYPEDAGSYIAMSSVIALKPSVDLKSTLKERLQILMEAKHYPVTNGPDFDLDLRIKDLQEKLQNIKS